MSAFGGKADIGLTRLMVRLCGSTFAATALVPMPQNDRSHADDSSRDQHELMQ
jgi:hypothetical protein